METYLAAIVSFHLKPHDRKWMPGQRESTILITAPKIVEETRTRDITGEEATHRLSFLADIVDTGGYAIKGVGASPMRDDLVAEANAMPDMFENYQSQVLNRVIDQEKMTRHTSAVKEMQEAIARNSGGNTMPDEPEKATGGERVISRAEEMRIPDYSSEMSAALNGTEVQPEEAAPVNVMQAPEIVMPEVNNPRESARFKPDVDLENSSALVKPEIEEKRKLGKVVVPGGQGIDVNAESVQKLSQKPVKNSIMELANNKDFSVATIAKEANRINRKEQSEIFISLH